MKTIWHAVSSHKIKQHVHRSRITHCEPWELGIPPCFATTSHILRGSHLSVADASISTGMVHCEATCTETRNGKSDLALWKWTVTRKAPGRKSRCDLFPAGVLEDDWCHSHHLLWCHTNPAFEQHLLQVPVNQSYPVDARDSEDTLCARSELLVEHSSVSHEELIFHISSLCS